MRKMIIKCMNDDPASVYNTINEKNGFTLFNSMIKSNYCLYCRLGCFILRLKDELKAELE